MPTLFHSADDLNAHIARLVAGGSAIKRVDAGNWDADTYLAAISGALNFPAYFGNNLDALVDCLRDVPASILAIYQFESFVAAAPEKAVTLIDILRGADQLTVFLQSDDPDLRIEGATTA